MFQIHRGESLTAENKMQRVLYIASLVGLFSIITLCVSCSNNQSSSSYVSERVEDLKKATAPSDASVREIRGNRFERHNPSRPGGNLRRLETRGRLPRLGKAPSSAELCAIESSGRLQSRCSARRLGG